MAPLICKTGVMGRTLTLGSRVGLVGERGHVCFVTGLGPYRITLNASSWPRQRQPCPHLGPERAHTTQWATQADAGRPALLKLTDASTCCGPLLVCCRLKVCDNPVWLNKPISIINSTCSPLSLSRLKESCVRVQFFPKEKGDFKTRRWPAWFEVNCF